jgi:hypothetical protein
VAASLRPEQRDGRLGDVDYAEQVRLDLRAERGEVGFLDGRDVAVPGIVDEHVDPTEPLRRGLDRPARACLVTDNEGHR